MSRCGKFGVEIATHVGAHATTASPYREVVAQKLHNEGAVLVRVLVQGVELRNGVVKRLEGGGERHGEG